MFRVLKWSAYCSINLFLALITVIPESFFNIIIFNTFIPAGINIILNRVLAFLIILVVVALFRWIYLQNRTCVTLKEHNYIIEIKYGNLFEEEGSKKVIPFDECFTTRVGNPPDGINPISVCGQYLEKYPIDDMQKLIDNANLKPVRGKSAFRNQSRYKSGSLIPCEDYLLMAFAKLDEHGAAIMSHDEFLECLFKLWKEIEIHYGQNDVCIPILGSGVTRMHDSSLTQQELLNIIIASYKITSHKIKYPYKLKIICRKQANFSLGNISDNFQ